MKTAASDGKLKVSDIVRADRIPGFETNLLRTTARVTQSGWASCFASTWWPECGSIETSIEHRFTSLELTSLRDALDSLSVASPEAITCDDVPIQRLVFMTDSDEKSLERLEHNPFDRDIPLYSASFTEVWNLIHQPFHTFITQQAEGGGGNSAALRASP